LADTIGFSDVLLELDEVMLSLDYCMSKFTPMSKIQSQSMNFEHRESDPSVVRSRGERYGWGGVASRRRGSCTDYGVVGSVVSS